MGIFWLNENWTNCFRNLIKIGLTPNVCTIFLFLTNHLVNQKNFDILLKIFEKLIPLIYTNLLFEKLSIGTIKILEFYLIGAPFSSQIIEKNIEKIMKIFPKINNENLKQNLIMICDCITKKHENLMMNANFNKFLQEIKTSLNYQTNTQVIQEILSSKDWLNFAKANNRQIHFKGLMNLGNSKNLKKYIFILIKYKHAT